MKPLEKTLKNQLEKTVREARDVAETAAKIALEQLSVGEAIPFAHLNESDREIRRKLRVHGRQLGDCLNGSEVQTMDKLIEEAAYEHWHRMLFARFLAENNLLMYPDPANPVPITLEECEDLASKEGAKNGWDLAARFAAHMLPQIFRPNSPVFQLSLPPEHQQKLERLMDELPTEVFTASDSLGWVYQFWQSKKKDEINASEVKIGARELPAVTQLFTEPYMVSFLLDNTLGAWWSARRLANELVNGESEEELRKKASLPNIPLEYLRFVKGKSGLLTPAAGTFDSWPPNLNELKVLDPCCGSGHFLVAAFLMLVPMRMALENLSAKDAVDAVLRDNLHGLEIDQRCVELAAFALALAAWRYPSAGGFRQLPEMNVACSGLMISAKKEDWLALAGQNINLSYALDALYEQFKDAPVLGSLINPETSLARGSLLEIRWEEVDPFLTKALSGEESYEVTEMGVLVKGLSKASKLLAKKYNLIITNVPYRGSGDLCGILTSFFDKYYKEARRDLATVFLERCLKLCVKGGTASIVLPQNWLFLTSYRRFREKLLTNEKWHLIARLGEGGFDSSAGAFTILIILSRENISERRTLVDSTSIISGIDASEPRTPHEKAAQLLRAEIKQVDQAKQLENPDARLMLNESCGGKLLSDYAETGTGMQSFDNPRFILEFWEMPQISNGWEYLQSTPSRNTSFSGMSGIVKWQDGKGDLFKMIQDKEVLEGYKSGIWKAGSQFWGSHGIIHGVMRDLPHSLYLGYPYDTNAAVLIPKNRADLLALWAYSDSKEFSKEVRKLDQKIMVTNATFLKVPFNKDHWVKVAHEKYPNGLPMPYSDDPTQWIFHGHPAKSTEPLQVAVIRLLGYRWPAEFDSAMQLSDEARFWVRKIEDLLSFADDDGIVCIPSVRGEMAAEDRLENLLAAAYGTEWSSAKRSELLAKADSEGKTLGSWIREKFFVKHCKLFHDRPFIWLIWDGLSDGFAALVNYHKLDSKLLETLVYTYLGDWISHQKQDNILGVDGAEEKLAAAEALKKRLELILEGDKPYDIFVRWKPMEQQPIGWNPDLNDGVIINIRPFMSVPEVGKKGAGVLRDKPNINWGKDRGRDVASAPWFKLGPVYGGHEGDRINDHHLSIAEKHEGRQNLVQSKPGGN
jgi:hypothetical protein